jgi:hypothetical protein
MRKLFLSLFVFILLVSCNQTQIRDRSQDSGDLHYDIDATIGPEMVKENIRKTSDFLILLSESHSKIVSSRFEEMLKIR